MSMSTPFRPTARTARAAVPSSATLVQGCFQSQSQSQMVGWLRETISSSGLMLLP